MLMGRQVAGRNYPPTNKNTLIHALTEEWDKLPQQLLDNVVQTDKNAYTRAREFGAARLKGFFKDVIRMLFLISGRTLEKLNTPETPFNYVEAQTSSPCCSEEVRRGAAGSGSSSGHLPMVQKDVFR
ncbi:hypothetical protein TNCV_3750311 [Trichonephila clavipes]|nr:hypothetical protein TNCV_3750311 [Trichonephila clavipes]